MRQAHEWMNESCNLDFNKWKWLLNSVAIELGHPFQSIAIAFLGLMVLLYELKASFSCFARCHVGGVLEREYLFGFIVIFVVVCCEVHCHRGQAIDPNFCFQEWCKNRTKYFHVYFTVNKGFYFYLFLPSTVVPICLVRLDLSWRLSLWVHVDHCGSLPGWRVQCPTVPWQGSISFVIKPGHKLCSGRN